jgi:2-keto-3-deoxy-L-rhamnonate aldolase RhmA
MPSLRQRLLRGATSYGPLLLSDSPIVAELLSVAGYGHVIVDHEHSPTDIRSGQAMLQAIQSAHHQHSASSSSSAMQTEAIVRLPAHDTVYMKKVLDSLRLPGGVLVPMVEDAATAEAVVQSTRYPWQDNYFRDDEDRVNNVGGIRGCAVPFVRGSSWGFVDQQEYMRQCQEDLLVMVQVESLAGVAAVPEIAAVPGIDAIFLGPMDLSGSIGKLGRFDDPAVKELMLSAEQAVRESPCLLAGFRSPGRDLKSMFVDAGYSLVCGTVDLGLLCEAARRDVDEANDATSSR